MRILIAGGTGVIGHRMLPHLLERGHDVTVLTRRPEKTAAIKSAGADAQVVDVFDGNALVDVVTRARPDVIMNQLTDLRSRDLRANAEIRSVGTANLVRAAQAAGTRRIIAQSVCWAYAPGNGPAVEETPLDLGADEPRRTTVLGVCDLEEQVRALPEWVVLRYGMFYGLGTWFAPDGLRATEARSGGLPADADVTSFVHVDDAAAAAVDALPWPTGLVNICDDEPAPGISWAPVFASAVGAPRPPVDDRERTPWARGASNAHARSELGWSPQYPTWRTGFAESLSAGPSL